MHEVRTTLAILALTVLFVHGLVVMRNCALLLAD
jgi:hypothetical protein